ncbi:MAG: F0F1 ATP synthase subunit A, partial [Gloeomargaritales cyanobacterium]
PLDQFQIIAIYSLKLKILDVSFTNLILIGIIGLLFLNYIILFSSKNNSFFFIPHNWQTIIENINEITSTLLYDNIIKKAEKYFPFFSMLFIFIIIVNLIGLIPYSFTITSHLIITFTISLSIFIGVNIVGFKKFKTQLLSLFLPANSSFDLALLLVPIEFILYFFKPISLGVRLFANLMAGHTLLKVIIGFAWSILLLKNLLSIFHIIPLIIVIVLFVLEFSVALIQAYVFIILSCIYLNDCINLH